MLGWNWNVFLGQIKDENMQFLKLVPLLFGTPCTCQTKSPTWPSNIGKDSCEMYIHFLCLLLLYWIKYAQHFALLNLRLKLQFCGEASLEFPINFPVHEYACVIPQVLDPPQILLIVFKLMWHTGTQTHRHTDRRKDTAFYS